MWYFYILKSEKDQNLYYGFTENLRRRFQEHQEGLSLSTKSRRPFRLVYYEAFASEKDARNREFQIKRDGKALGQLKRRIVRSVHEA